MPLLPWLRARARVEAGAMARTSPEVQRAFEHAWAPVRELGRQLRRLPPELWPYLLSCPGGFVVLGAGESRYEPGPAAFQGRTLQNVAYLSLPDVAGENDRPLHGVGPLIDHYLGCPGNPEGPWFSEGGGTRLHWGEAGARLAALYALGYGVDEVARAGLRDYFAQSLALYCRDRRRLTTADPQVTRWLRATLWNAAFWKE